MEDPQLRSFNARNRRILLERLVLREVQVHIYERKGLRTLGLTSSEQTLIQKTHTDDEASADDEIRSKDAVHLSIAKL